MRDDARHVAVSHPDGWPMAATPAGCLSHGHRHPNTGSERDRSVLYAGKDSVITGLAALDRHGVRVADSGRITLLVPATRSRKGYAFLDVWATTRMPEYVYHDGPVRFVMPARAVADGIREWGVAAT